MKHTQTARRGYPCACLVSLDSGPTTRYAPSYNRCMRAEQQKETRASPHLPLLRHQHQQGQRQVLGGRATLQRVQQPPRTPRPRL